MRKDAVGQPLDNSFLSARHLESLQSTSNLLDPLEVFGKLLNTLHRGSFNTFSQRSWR